MRIDFRLVGWGVFLILAGSIPLAVTQDWIPADLRWWELWPLILIGAGVGLLLRRTSAAPLGGLIVAATFGLMLGGVLASGITFPVGNVGCLGDRAGDPFPTQNGGFESRNVDVLVDMPCGDVEIGTAPGSGWSLSGTSDGGEVPDVAASGDRLAVRAPDGDGDILRSRSSWVLTLPTDPTLDVEVRTNAGSARLDLADASLGRVRVGLNAGDATVDLSGATAERLDVEVNAGSAGVLLPVSSMTGTLTVNAGSIELCSQPGVALRIRVGDNITASYDYADAGLIEVSENTWESPDWAGADARIELSTTANAGSFALDPEGGCK
jgi:hypothetical protein